MDKQFKEFKAMVPIDFKEQFIQFVMKDEKVLRDQAIEFYFKDNKYKFDELNERVAGKICKFRPDLGYAHSDSNGRHCFEIVDNNWCIPVELLAPVN